MGKKFQSNNRCKFCGAQVKEWWHALTPGLVEILFRFAAGVNKKSRNEINLQLDITLDKNQYNNFQKLRFFKLVERVGKEGLWKLTPRGAQFLCGDVNIPYRVLTFRGAPITYSPDMVNIMDYLGELPVFERQFSYQIRAIGKQDQKQAALSL